MQKYHWNLPNEISYRKPLFSGICHYFSKVGGWLAFQHLVILVIYHSLGEVGGLKEIWSMSLNNPFFFDPVPNQLTSSKLQFDHTDTKPNCVKWAPDDQVMFLWQGKDFCCFICPWSNQYPAWLECSFSGWYPDCDGWWGKVKSILRRRFSCHSTMGPL